MLPQAARPLGPAAIALAGLLAGCGPVPDTRPQGVRQPQERAGPSEEVRERLGQLEGQTQGLGKRLEKLADSLGALEEQRQELDSLGKRVERLEEALKELDGRTQVNAKEVDRMTDQLQRVYGDWGGRLEQVEEQQELLLDQLQAEGFQGKDRQGETAQRQQKAQETEAGEGAMEDEPLSATAPPKEPEKEEESAEEDEGNEARQAYQEAFQMVKDGEYEKAREALRRFLGDYPGSEYADNAQYWLAETYYVLGEYENALEEFGRVTESYPDSGKVPAAKLKMGYSYYELEDYRQARKELIGVMDDHPDHRVADLAKQQLQKIRKEQF